VATNVNAWEGFLAVKAYWYNGPSLSLEIREKSIAATQCQPLLSIGNGNAKSPISSAWLKLLPYHNFAASDQGVSSDLHVLGPPSCRLLTRLRFYASPSVSGSRPKNAEVPIQPSSKPFRPQERDPVAASPLALKKDFIHSLQQM